MPTRCDQNMVAWAQESWSRKTEQPDEGGHRPEGEDIARKSWSKHEPKTPPHALSGLQG